MEYFQLAKNYSLWNNRSSFGVLRFEGGMNLQAFVYAIWEPFAAIGIILWILHFFEKKFNQPSHFKSLLFLL